MANCKECNGKGYFEYETGVTSPHIPYEKEIAKEPCDCIFERNILLVSEKEASPSVIEMLANLSRRIVRLEAENKRILDELDTLHANQKRLGEDLANAKSKTPFEADEVIVELAKLLVEASRATAKQGGRR